MNAADREALLMSWTKPSSDSEKDKQERAERMVKQAVRAHEPLADAGVVVFTKGSYANETNVKSDSDVDIAVKCTKLFYWEDHTPDAHTPGSGYTGEWTPSKLRAELTAALKEMFGDEIDTSGSTAIHIAEMSSRVSIDVVPCFDFKHYFSETSWREGTKVFRSDNRSSIVNYPDQQLVNGRTKNKLTNYNYKKLVRILKRVENALAENGLHDELPSYFIECLGYNVPNEVLGRATWTDRVRGALAHIYNSLEGGEPSEGRWLEVNECKYLFHSDQKWSRGDGRSFALAAWQYLELSE